MKYEYRIVSRFDGDWELQSRPTKEAWAKHYHKSDPTRWPDHWVYVSSGRYEEVLKTANRMIAKQDYVPTELTPPFPDKDPKLPKRRPNMKGWF
jgi:hypothetical protein